MSVAVIEMAREPGSRFLGYRGVPLPLPCGWEAWNAYRSGTLVSSLALSRAPAACFDWAEADYEGPFFAPGAHAAVLAGLGLPVYAAFANARLGERLRVAHRPAG